MISPSTLKSKNIQGKFPGANRNAKKADFSTGATLTQQPGGERFTGLEQQLAYTYALGKIRVAQGVLGGMALTDARFASAALIVQKLERALQSVVKDEPRRIG